jgi:hypothetical protein
MAQQKSINFKGTNKQKCSGEFLTIPGLNPPPPKQISYLSYSYATVTLTRRFTSEACKVAFNYADHFFL